MKMYNQMESREIILKIKKCIKSAHKFSEGLGDSTSIHKDYIIDSLKDISSTKIHIALLEMKEKGEIKFTTNDPVILLKEDFKYE